MHLLALRPPPGEVEKVASSRAEGAYKALAFLTDVPQKRRQVIRDRAFDVGKLVDEALELKQRLREATDRRDFLQHRIAAVEPWGDIEFPPHEALAGHRLWFYLLPLGKLDALQGVELPWRIVGRDHRFAYAVIISKDEPSGDILPVQRTHTGALPLSELAAQLEEAEIEIEDLIAAAPGPDPLRLPPERQSGRSREQRVAPACGTTDARREPDIVAVQGWVPAAAVPDVESYAEARNLACLIEDPRTGRCSRPR